MVKTEKSIYKAEFVNGRSMSAMEKFNFSILLSKNCNVLEITWVAWVVFVNKL